MDVGVGVVTVTVTVEEREDILNKALSIRENNVFLFPGKHVIHWSLVTLCPLFLGGADAMQH